MTDDALREQLEHAANAYMDEHDSGSPTACSYWGFLAGAEWVQATLAERIEALPVGKQGEPTKRRILALMAMLDDPTELGDLGMGM